MLDQARESAGERAFSGARPFEVGVSTGLAAVPRWKLDADFLFVQVSFSLDRLLTWRSSIEATCPVYAGVMVVASERMAAGLAASVPDIELPPTLVAGLASDRDAGVLAALDLVEAIRDSGAFDGVHLIPVSRYRQVAALLEQRR